MSQVLMPKATAVWLVENTALTFDQIAAFCTLHPLEVQSIADEETAIGIVGYDPIANDQLTPEEIKRCEGDASARLQLAANKVPRPTARTKGPRYTPVARRQDRPDAIAWLLRNFPELSDAQISRLVGTTKPTINGVRDRTHWNSPNIKPRDPVALGLINRDDLTTAIEKARRAAERAEQRKAREEAKAQAAAGVVATKDDEAPTDTETNAEDAAAEIAAKPESSEPESGEEPSAVSTPSNG